MSEFRIMVTVHGRGEPVRLEYDGKSSLMEAMQKQGVYISASCGGRGTCGKCKLQVREGILEATAWDRTRLSPKELKEGYRLACGAYPKEACTVSLAEAEEDEFEVIGGSADHRYGMPAGECRQTGKSSGGMQVEDGGMDKLTAENSGYAIAIDMGTTTLALRLVRICDNQVLRTYTAVNRQRAYGADIITRIKASAEGKQELLRTCIQRDLLEGIRWLTGEAGTEPGTGSGTAPGIEQAFIDNKTLSENKTEAVSEQVSHITPGVSGNRITRIAVAGNTAMGHLLLGYSCETLGVYPYRPVDIGRITLPFADVFAREEFRAKVTLLPGISAFVGGDIVSGLYSCDFDRRDKPCLFLDLGTNAEMAIGNKDRIMVTSAAAGPAFEGGNIEYGVGSIPGAIRGMTIQRNVPICKTIGDKSPVGICGTGVIEIASELLKAGLMDETGLLCEEYFEQGYTVAADVNGKAIRFTQKDIRELQLAKAAIRAGIEILIRRYGTSYEELDTVYLAGGFGYRMDIKKAVHMGLLPGELYHKTKAIGNSSLDGATRCLSDAEADRHMEHILAVAEELHLSGDEAFNGLYIGFMNFDSQSI